MTIGSSTTAYIVGADGEAGIPGVDGSNGPGDSGSVGGDGDGALNVVNGNSAIDTGSGLLLTIGATGGTAGSGGSGGDGASGATQSEMVNEGSYFLTVDNTTGGYAGASGVSGGNGGVATASYTASSLNPAGSRNDEVSVFAQGGSGGGGGSGGNGGSTDNNILVYAALPNDTVVVVEETFGGGAGPGRSGGQGGDGAAATTTIRGDTFADGVSLQAFAYGGAGGAGGDGGAGGSGVGVADGSYGGAGGLGGAATAVVESNSISLLNSPLNIDVEAVSGEGGDGGAGGNAGEGEEGSIGAAGSSVDNLFGFGGPGGDGGDENSATAIISGNSIVGSAAADANVVSLNLTSYIGRGGIGGGGAPDEVYGLTLNGSDGAVNAGTIQLTNNFISLHGPSAALYITLQAFVENDSPAGGAVASLAGQDVVVSGNTFIGGGEGTLSLSESFGDARIDVADELLSLDNSPNNAMTGFSTIAGTEGDDVFVDGSGDQTYILDASDGASEDQLIFTSDHGNDTVEINGGSSFTIELEGFGPSLDSFSQVEQQLSGEEGAVIDTPDGGSLTLDVDPASLTAANFEFSAACFCAGTYLLTDRGEVAVETLRVGDLVPVVLRDLPATIVWIGHRRVDCQRHPTPEKVWPIRIAPHAFGRGQPARTLWLSPDHAVFADGVLIPVKHLINGTTVRQVAQAQVTYWHVELDTHDVLLAEGMPCESYLDTGCRNAFTNGGGVTMLHPEFEPHPDSQLMWECLSCAPLVVTGPVLERARERLAQRAKIVRTAAARAA